MAYRAEIEIGVKGASRLKELQDRLTKLGRAIEDANAQTIINNKAIQSVNEYSRALSKATSNLNETQIQLDKNGKAIGNYKDNIRAYVTALGASNQAQKITNDLIKQEISARTRATAELKAYNAAAAAPTRRGAATTMAGAYLRGSFKGGSQYAGPIGPGAASPTALASPLPASSRFFGGTQYSGPIGPGAASSILGGQSSPVGERIQRQLQGDKELLEVREAINKLDQESIRAHNARLDLQAEYLTVLQRTADAAKFRAAQPQPQQLLALPSSEMLKARDPFIQRIKTGEELINDAIKEGNVLREQAAATDARRAEKLREQAQALTGVKNALPGFEALTGQSSPISPVRTAAGARAATGFPIALPETQLDREVAQREKINNLIDDQITFNSKLSDGLKRQAAVGLDINNLEKSDLKLLKNQVILKKRELETEQKIRAAIDKGTKARRGRESALIGGAFPLLFGQGLGAAAGGGLGGFLGGKAGGQLGFGLSLVGTAIGQAFDDAFKRVTDIGNAIRSLDLSALENSAIRVSEQLKFQVNQLKEQGQLARARALIENTVAKQTGTTATVVKDIANSGNILNAAFKELLASGGVLLGAVAAPFAVALAGILKVVSEIVKLVNRLIALVGGFLRQIQGLIDPSNRIQKAIEKLAPSLAEATAEAKKFAAELLKGLEIAQNTADFELQAAQQAPVGNTAENKIQRRRIQLEREFRNIRTDINTKLKEANKLSNEDRITAVRRIALLKSTLERTAELNALRDITNIKLQEEQRIQRENLRIAKERERLVGERLRQVRQEVDAVIEANAAVRRLESFVLPDKTPFRGASPKEERDRRLAEVEAIRVVNLEKLSNAELSESIKLEQRRRINATADLEKLKIRAQFINEERKEVEESIKARLAVERSLNNQINLIDAKLNGNREEVEIAQEVNSLKEGIKHIDVEDAEAIERQVRALRDRKKLEEAFDIKQQTRFAGAGLQAGFIGQAGQAFESKMISGASRQEAANIAQLTQQMELAQLQATALQDAVLGIGNAFATAMTTGVSELIAGTKSAQEVFADFLKNVGDALIQAATQMIATYIAIGIAKAFAGLSGGGGSQPNIHGQNVTDVLNNPGLYALPRKATGGPVNRNSSYIVGEQGPELFTPNQAGRISSTSDTRSLLGRSPVGQGAPAMNFTFETTNIGGKEFVDREQLEAAMAVTRRQAASDGAKKGMGMTLDKMQHSPATRRRVGIS